MLKEWLNNWLHGDQTEELNIRPDGYVLAGLNLKEVLDSHNAWKVKLEKELEGEEDVALDVAVIGSDCHCVLGQWLHGEGKERFCKVPEFSSALDAHAQFHISAAEVVIEHRSGNTEKAHEMLKTTFRHASNLN